MKKKGLAIVLGAMMLLGTVNVLAEEWVPKDSFYEQHAEECIQVDREYCANGPNGKVVIYESPASSKVMGTMENGEIVLVDYVYTNDQQIMWGFCDMEGQLGWVPMPYMVLLYDYISFAEEYKNQIQEERGKVDIHYMVLENSDYGIEFWTYPGSARSYRFILDGWGDGMPEYTHTFVDEDGRKWGFVDYYLGDNVKRWVCISKDEDLFLDYEERYPNGGPKRDKTVMEEYSGAEIFPDDYEIVQKELKRKQVLDKIMIIGGGVLLAFVVIVFYWRLWKKIKQA